MKFEVAVIPVGDVDRSKAFYNKLGWRLDADFPFDNGFRVVQFMPPGSGCSVQFGTRVTTAAPGSAQGLYLIVSDVEAARNELVTRGVEVSEVFHTSSPGAQFRPNSNGRLSGPAPDHRSYFSFATFNDQDGNTLFSVDDASHPAEISAAPASAKLEVSHQNSETSFQYSLQCWPNARSPFLFVDCISLFPAGARDEPN